VGHCKKQKHKFNRKLIRNFTRKIPATLRVRRNTMLSTELALYQQLMKNIPVSLRIKDETNPQEERAKLRFHPQF